jgi:uncharacterized protein (TIGR01777 family)
MDIFVTGGSGFLGKTLCQHLLDRGHEVTALSRSAEASARLPRGVGHCLGDPTLPGPWQEEAARYQGFINLAGASIFERWTDQHKALIRESRVNSTRNLVQAMARRLDQGPATLVSASAVGYYGFHGDETLTEEAPPGEDFLAQVCRQWEEEASRAGDLGARVVRARFGIVLGGGGGALGKMLPIFRRGLGGPLGHGHQWLSWIHQADLVEAVVHCLESEGLRGPVNCTSPHPVTNRDLAHALGHALRRPSFLPAPGLAVKLALGEFGSVLLEGQRVMPAKLLDDGFAFRFPTLEAALADLLGGE